MSMKAPGKLYKSETVDLDEFCNRDVSVVSEHIHIVPDRDEREIMLFRSVGDDPDDWIHTDLTDATTNFARNLGGRRPRSFFVTDGNADNLLTWLDRLRVERSHPNINLEWWETNNSPMVDDSDMDHESIFMRYTTVSGRSNKIEMDGLYKNDIQMMANF